MLFLLCLYSVSVLKPRYHILSFLTSNFSECVAAGLFVQRKIISSVTLSNVENNNHEKKCFANGNHQYFCTRLHLGKHLNHCGMVLGVVY